MKYSTDDEIGTFEEEVCDTVELAEKLQFLVLLTGSTILQNSPLAAASFQQLHRFFSYQGTTMRKLIY